MIDLHPTVCNLCGGTVDFTSNARIYGGRTYGSGKCYLCRECGAYVGTHKPRPKEAMGLLANKEMRNIKINCHELFDRMWTGAADQQKKRGQLYAWLAERLEISPQDCHFGYFDLAMLKKAYRILLTEKEEINYMMKEV